MTKFAAVFVGIAAAATDCGNGNSCPDNSTCITRVQGAGSLFACSPPALGPHPTICGDSRFSCPSGAKCDDLHGDCLGHTNLTIPHSTNVASNSSLATTTSTVCSVIGPYLPSFCTCANSSKGALGGLVTCNVDVLGVDTITVIGDVEPCSNPMYMSVEVKEADIGFDFGPYKVAAGDQEEIDVGLDIGIPDIANAGIYLAVLIQGNIDAVELKLGVDVCGSIPIVGKECGSKISKSLPIWLLDTTVSFGGTCA